MKYLIVTTFALLTAVSPFAMSRAMAFTPAEKQEIVDEVVQHFMDHPELLMEAIAKWRKQANDQLVEPADGETSALPRIVDLKSGNPDGTISILDFADYGCEVCSAQSLAIEMAAAKDNRISIVERDLPLSGDDAQDASLDLIATATAGKDWKTLKHTYLNQGIQPETRIKALYDIQSHPSDGDRNAAQTTLSQNAALARRAGITRLPSTVLVVGGKVVKLDGLQTAEQIAYAIKQLETEQRPK